MCRTCMFGCYRRLGPWTYVYCSRHCICFIVVTLGMPYSCCAFCDSSDTLFCGGCFTVMYCSRKCQKKHWKLRHRLECNRQYLCQNFKECHVQYALDEHPDPEYCGVCGTSFGPGECCHTQPQALFSHRLRSSDSCVDRLRLDTKLCVHLCQLQLQLLDEQLHYDMSNWWWLIYKQTTTRFSDAKNTLSNLSVKRQRLCGVLFDLHMWCWSFHAPKWHKVVEYRMAAHGVATHRVQTITLSISTTHNMKFTYYIIANYYTMHFI